VRLPTGEYLVDGGMAVSDLNELLDTNIPNADWDTVAGFFFNTFGEVPKLGDSIEHDGWQFVAEEVEGRRIRRIKVILTAFDDDDDEQPANGDSNAAK
jgi:CBS domain containing-hemolysin-like protein